MSALLFSNLDFEYELAAKERYRPSPQLEKLCRHWKYILRLLPGMSQAECVELNSPSSQPTSRLLPWGITPRILQMACELGLEREFPPVDLVREVNDKRYSHKLEKELQIALAYSEIIETTRGFQNAIQSCPYDWVLKHPFGVSARERALGKAGEISPSALGWARKRLEQGWSLVFEPWVERTREFSIHFDIEPSGQVRYLGQCDLVTDQGGVYRGNRVIPGTQDEDALAPARKVVEELARRGYWGPVGIDAFRGVLGTQEILRPLVEINARYSFGRLTLALAGWIPETWCCFWCHAKAMTGQTALPQLPPAPSQAGAYRLPPSVDPEQVSTTVVFIAPTRSELNSVLQAWGVGSSERGSKEWLLS